MLLPFIVKKKLYLLYVFIFAIISVLATQLYCYVFAQCGCSIIKCLSDYLWQTLVPLIFFSFVWILYRYLEQQQEVEEIKKERTEMELKFLKSQINPHVLFNNLNTIYSYSLEKPEETSELILMLSDNLKHVIYESNAQKIALDKELQFIENYLHFQRIRLEGVKTIIYTVEVDNGEYIIAPLLLITIIENAFKYSKMNSEISIAIKVKDGILNCLCKNVIGQKTELTEDSPQIGLTNLKKRLGLLYADKHSLQIEKDKEFKVALQIQL